MRHAPTTDDADFTWEKYEASYNELANDLGNLVQRLATLCKKNEIASLKPLAVDLDDEFKKHMDAYAFNVAFDYAWSKVQDLNRQIDAAKPWELAKTDPAKAKSVLKDIASQLLAVSQMLEIFIPTTAKKIQDVFTATQILPPSTPLFPRG